MTETKAARPTRDPRAFAWAALRRVEAGDFSDAVVGNGLRNSPMSPRDRGLATRLVYGSLAWRGHLDYILSKFSQRAIADIDPGVRDLLRLATYQICHLGRVPDFAAVDTAVRLAKREERRASGFVNAILRKVAARWREVELPARDANLARHLSVRYSHPCWLVERWLRELGEEATEALLAANNEAAPTCLRVNTLAIDRAALLARLEADSVRARATSWAPHGVRCVEGEGITRLLDARTADFTVQGEASQLAGLLVGARPGERILDLCAAPGGKTTLLAETMENRGRVDAIDVAESGVETVKAEAERLHLSIVNGAVADGTSWGSDRRPFDRVLVDAPCTGLGTLRQHPEIRWRRQEPDIPKNATLQRRLLQNAARLVRPGGTLVYATCTIAPEENEQHVDWLVDELGWEIEPAGATLGSGFAELIDARGFLRTSPARGELDGFFAARLKRPEPASSVRP